MMVLFLDANVPLYAVGGESPYKRPSEVILEAIGAGTILGFTDAAMIQELVQVGVNRGRLDGALIVAQRLIDAGVTVLPVDAQDCAAMMQMLREHRHLGSHDALHLAVMRRHGLTHIVTADRHFIGLPGITVLDPHAAAQLLAP